MSDKPTRRAILIGAASTAVATILPMPSKASVKPFDLDRWEALDAQLENFDQTMRRLKPSVLDQWEPIDGEALAYGEESDGHR